MLQFRRIRTFQKFSTVHFLVRTDFPTERSLQDRNPLKQSSAGTVAERRSLLAVQPKERWG
jgi:hypothetical protein